MFDMFGKNMLSLKWKTVIQQKFNHFSLNNSLLMNKKASSIRRCLFVCGKRYKDMAEREKKTIYCPSCNRKAFEIYARSGMVVSNKCSKCKKLVVFNPRYGVKLKPIPERQCSSGMRFY